MRIFANLGEGERRQSYRYEILHKGRGPDVITHANLGDDRFRGF